MKGDVSGWIWIIGGILIGIAIMVFGLTLAANMFRTQDENAVIAQFEDLANRMSTVCNGGQGNADFKQLVIPDIGVAIYASGIYADPPLKVSDLVSAGAESSGNYVCLKFLDKDRPACKQLECPANLTYMGSPALREDLTRTLSKLTGGQPLYRFTVNIEKDKGAVYALTRGRPKTADTCTINTLAGIEIAGTCDGNPLAIFYPVAQPKLAFFGDTTYFSNGTLAASADGQSFKALLTKVHSNLGGGRVLFLSESTNNFEQARNPELAAFLASAGDARQHNSKVTLAELASYQQLWIMLPGFCAEQERKRAPAAYGCSGIAEWDDSELAEVAGFLAGGGKLFIVSDMSAQVLGRAWFDPAVANKLLALAGSKFIQLDISKGFVCKNSAFNGSSSLQGISFAVKSAARVGCPA